MRFAYDPWMIRDRAIDDVCRFAVEVGYAGIELSPREDLFPLFDEPKATRESLRQLRASLDRHKLQLASMWTVYRWANPREREVCDQAVDFFRQFIDAAQELGCKHISSEFGGSSDDVAGCRDAFLRSLDAILPVVERAQVTLSLDPHPGDWVEDGREAVLVIRQLNCPNLRLLYSAPHSFYLDAGDDLPAFIREVGDLVSFVRVADTFDHRPAVRYIVNPLNAPVRVHQHLNIGEGEIAWSPMADALREVGYDGWVSNSVFAWPDRAEESARRMLRCMGELFGDDRGASAPADAAETSR